MSLARSVVKRPVLYLVVFALVSVSALFLVPNIGFDMFPEIEMPFLVVSTSYPGADPETVEKSITEPLEGALANTAGITEMKSESRDQLSMIVLEFAFGSNMDAKVNRVRENISKVADALPDSASEPSIMILNPNSSPIMRIALTQKEAADYGFSQNDLRAFAKNNIKDKLTQAEGVASCDVEGGEDAIVLAALSHNRLEAYGITITEIGAKLAAQNAQLGAGYISDGLLEYSIKTSGAYTDVRDIADTVIAQSGGADIRLRDIGEVRFDYEEERAAAFINGEAGVYLSIMKQSGSNTVKVAESIYKKIDEIKKTLPANISLEIIEDSTVQTRAMVSELINSAVLGIILAVAVLFLFFRSINSSIIVGISIPISFLITLFVMSIAGITINMMTLAGLILGLGMIVDSSIVVLEAVTKFRERGEKPSLAAILAGEEVMSSIIASTITTICVFVPVYLFKNQLEIIGLLLQDLLFTIGISVLSSLLVAIFLVPPLASKWLPVHSRLQKPIKNRALAKLDGAIDGALNAITAAYKNLLVKALRHRLAVILLVIAAFAGSVISLSLIDIKMFPDMDSDTITIDIEMPLGTRYEDTRAAALEISEYAIAEINGAKNITTSAGTSASMFGASGSNQASVTVVLDLDDKNADTSEIVKEKLRAHFNAFPGAVIKFTESGMASLGASSDIDVVLEIDDIQKGVKDAEKIKALIEERVEGIRDAALGTTEGLPQVSVNIDRLRAYNMGLTTAQIANEIAASFNGTTATTYKKSGDTYDVVLRLQKEDRYEIPDLGKIFVRSSNGTLFSVSNFAALERGLGPEAIKREGGTKVIHITANVARGVSVSGTQNAVQKLLDEEGTGGRLAGGAEDTSNMLQTFLQVIVLALLLVFGVMAAQYESFRDPLINFCTIPLVLIGVVAIHIITQSPMSAFTMIGFVMLAGIVVNNGIILVDYINLLVRAGGGTAAELFEACAEGGAARFRPVLMTALTTMLGLAPMAFFPGSSSQMTAPIGLAVFGGLASATFITLFFIPVMYTIIHKAAIADARAEAKNEA